MESEPHKRACSDGSPANELVTDYPQFLYVQTIDEDLDRCISDYGESADEYWAQGWNLSFCDGHRTNYDEYDGLYRKTFPTRYRLAELKLDREQNSVVRRNADLDYVIRPLRITPLKESLYLQHHLFRFNKPPRETLSKRYEYIKGHPARLLELCIFDRDELVAFSIFEQGEYSLWSNAGIWSPRHARRSLGTLTILREMSYAAAQRCTYYYMGGYYIHNPNYAYKTRFPGLELYDWDNGRWLDYHDPYVPEMLQQNLPRKD